MENFIIYMVKASGLLALFFAAYYMLLRKETFFNSNRWFLLAGLLTSIVLPLVTYTKTIWIDPVPTQSVQVLDLQQVLSLQKAAITEPDPITINWFDVVAGIYIAGALFFFTRFIFNFISLRKMLKGQKAIKEDGFIFIDTPNTESPFSFFNYIVYNSALLKHNELESILCHEKVHSRQKHSADMLLGQLYCIVFWFNPFSWMFKKTVSQNLEFIADAEAIRQLSDKTSYQKTLLKITVQPSCTSITNHFYQSLIKKRIVMLNKKQSRKRNSWKYAVILPALTAFILLFQVRTIAQEKAASTFESGSVEKTKIAIEVNKDSKEADLQKETQVFKDKFDTDVAISNVTRNTKSEITGIKVVIIDKTQSKVYEVSGTEPITPFTIEVEKSSASPNNAISFGTPRQGWNNQNGAYVHNEDEDFIIMSAPVDPLAPMAVPQPPANMMMVAPQAPICVESDKLVIKTGNNKDALVVLNGVKQKQSDMISIAPGQQVTNVIVLDEKEGKKKYGKEGKKGAIEITTKEGKAGRCIIQAPGVSGYSLNAPVMIPIPQIHDFEGLLNFETMIPEDIIAFSDIKIDPNIDFDVIVKSFNEAFSKEEMEKMKTEIKKSLEDMKKAGKEITRDQAQFAKKHAELEKMRAGEKYDEAEIQQARKELEETRKEIEQARQEIEQARKELAKELKNMKSE